MQHTILAHDAAQALMQPLFVALSYGALAFIAVTFSLLLASILR